MPATLGFLYERDGYDTSGKRLLGRQAAGESFLKSLLRHTRAEKLYCVARSQEQYKDCIERARSWQVSRDLKFAPLDDPQRIAEAGVFYRPDPGLGELAWMRRFGGQRLYSLCGVTHTICTKEVMRHFGNLAIAPLQAWDALICTSDAVKTAVERTIDEWTGYLALRCGGKPPVNLKLPVIPLGIDAASFAPSKDTQTIRAGLRKTLDVAENDIVLLYVGRLNFYAKAHPIPMYFAAERAARATGKKVHLLQVGWFEQDREETAFKDSAKKFCPSVQCIFLDGRRPEVRRQAWAAGDIFISLSDNIQETFGLTPLEAMASGLPVICTDWDGYQQTVRHDIDGFRVPVSMPPPGSGVELARDYLSDRLMYNGYIGRACLSTAADVNAVTRALITLIEQPDLRKKMAAAGQERAKSEFDWSVIIRQYEALWDELAELRTSAEEVAAPAEGRARYPLCDDPYRVFSHYTDHHLGPETKIELGGCGSVAMLTELLKDWMVSFGADRRLKANEFSTLLNRLKNGPARLEDFFSLYPNRQPELYRTIGWLLKFDIIKLA
jgi:starch synthase